MESQPSLILHLITTADDFGYARVRDEGILIAMEHGAVAATSIMVSGASAETSMSALPRHYLDQVGLHLNLTEGLPLSSDVHSLLLSPEDEYFAAAGPTSARFADSAPGSLRGKFGFREALKAGFIQLDDVRREVNAQVDRFISLHPDKRPPVHVDGHQHVHVLPGVRDVVREVMLQRGIRFIRLPTVCSAAEEGFLKDLEAGPPASVARAAFYRQISEETEEARAFFNAADADAGSEKSPGIQSTDCFIGYSVMSEDSSVDKIIGLLEAIASEALTDHAATATGAGVHGPIVRRVELMTHPGHPVPASATTTTAGCGGPLGPDDFSKSEARRHELDVMVALKGRLEACNYRILGGKAQVALVGWNASFDSAMP